MPMGHHTGVLLTFLQLFRKEKLYMKTTPTLPTSSASLSTSVVVDVPPPPHSPGHGKKTRRHHPPHSTQTKQKSTPPPTPSPPPPLEVHETDSSPIPVTSSEKKTSKWCHKLFSSRMTKSRSKTTSRIWDSHGVNYSGATNSACSEDLDSSLAPYCWPPSSSVPPAGATNLVPPSTRAIDISTQQRPARNCDLSISAVSGLASSVPASHAIYPHQSSQEFVSGSSLSQHEQHLITDVSAAYSAPNPGVNCPRSGLMPVPSYSIGDCLSRCRCCCHSPASPSVGDLPSERLLRLWSTSSSVNVVPNVFPFQESNSYFHHTPTERYGLIFSDSDKASSSSRRYRRGNGKWTSSHKSSHGHHEKSTTHRPCHSSSRSPLPAAVQSLLS